MLLYIRTHWYPCRNPRECAEQAQLFQEQMRVDLQFGRQQLHVLLNSTPHSITASDATVEQLAQAGFSYREVVGVVRQEWWRRADMPEYKVRMLAFPVTAIRRASELQMVAES